MREMAKKSRMKAMSHDLMDLLDDIYQEAKCGNTQLEMDKNIKISYRDVEILRLMGYEVTCAFLRLNEVGKNGNVELEFLKVVW